MKGLPPEGPVTPKLHEMTRGYTLLGGLPKSLDKSWGPVVQAHNAIEAVRQSWVKGIKTWVELDYETVYCFATKEILYVKTVYSWKTRTSQMSLMLEKPKRLARITDPRKKVAKPLPTSVPSGGIVTSM